MDWCVRCCRDVNANRHKWATSCSAQNEVFSTQDKYFCKYIHFSPTIWTPSLSSSSLSPSPSSSDGSLRCAHCMRRQEVWTRLQNARSIEGRKKIFLHTILLLLHRRMLNDIDPNEKNFRINYDDYIIIFSSTNCTGIFCAYEFLLLFCPHQNYSLSTLIDTRRISNLFFWFFFATEIHKIVPFAIRVDGSQLSELFLFVYLNGIWFSTREMKNEKEIIFFCTEQMKLKRMTFCLEYWNAHHKTLLFMYEPFFFPVFSSMHTFSILFFRFVSTTTNSQTFFFFLFANWTYDWCRELSVLICIWIVIVLIVD